MPTVAELANAFPDGDAIRELLDEAAIPWTRLRPYGSLEPEFWWRDTLRKLEQGLVVGGLDALLSAAGRLRPDNAKLKRFAPAAQPVVVLSVDAAAERALQKVIGKNHTFLDVVAWRTRLAELEGRVCRVEHNGRGIGTGFLVGPDLVLTNHHVVETPIGSGSWGGWGCRFDYQRDTEGVREGRLVAIHPGAIDAAPPSAWDLVSPPRAGEPAAEELDFALLRLTQRVGAEAAAYGEGQRGWVTLPKAAIDYAAVGLIGILQHPRARPLKLALGVEGVTLNSSRNRLRYDVPTLDGSSGSPVFDGDWRLIGLHHSGDPESKLPQFNEAIPAALIAARPKVAAALGK